MTQPVKYGLALPDNLLFCSTGIALSFEDIMYHVSEGNTTILTVLRSVVITEWFNFRSVFWKEMLKVGNTIISM